MPQIIMEAIATRQSPSAASNSYQNLFVEGGYYVFDGNRVIARFRIGRNGVGRWRLETIDPGFSLVITPDLRSRKYQGIGSSCLVQIIRKFESVFDALKPLDEAVCNCAQHGHAWSPTQSRLSYADAPYSWQWCLVCGAEQLWFPENAECLIWPEDAAEIAVRTAGFLPRLHGPVVGRAS